MKGSRTRKPPASSTPGWQGSRRSGIVPPRDAGGPWAPRSALTWALLAALLPLAWGQEPPPAQPVGAVRILHLATTPADLALLIDGEVRSDALAVGRSSGYLSVPAGERTVGVADVSGGTLTAVEATVDVVEGAYLTVLVLDAGAQTVDLYPLADGLGALPPPGRALARLVHAAPGAPALSGLLIDEPGGAAVDDPARDLAVPSFAEVEVGSAGDYQVLPANRYHLRLQQQDGTAVLEREELALDAGAVYTLVAHGGVDGVTLTVLVDVITPSAGR